MAGRLRFFTARIFPLHPHVYSVQLIPLIWALVAATMVAQAAVIVQLRVLDGEAAVHTTTSRATRGITVQVTDETGKPVDGATVSFRLPEQGPGGTFNGGLKTEVVSTRADGKATVFGMQWNKIPGPFEVRITAVKDQARAGLVSTQYLSDAVAAATKSGGTGTFQASRKLRPKWLLVAGAVAVGAGAGMVLARSHTPAASTAAPTPATVIGIPSIIIGGPK